MIVRRNFDISFATNLVAPLVAPLVAKRRLLPLFLILLIIPLLVNSACDVMNGNCGDCVDATSCSSVQRQYYAGIKAGDADFTDELWLAGAENTSKCAWNAALNPSSPSCIELPNAECDGNCSLSSQICVPQPEDEGCRRRRGPCIPACPAGSRCVERVLYNETTFEKLYNLVRCATIYRVDLTIKRPDAQVISAQNITDWILEDPNLAVMNLSTTQYFSVYERSRKNGLLDTNRETVQFYIDISLEKMEDSKEAADMVADMLREHAELDQESLLVIRKPGGGGVRSMALPSTLLLLFISTTVIFLF